MHTYIFVVFLFVFVGFFIRKTNMYRTQLLKLIFQYCINVDAVNITDK